MSEGGDGERSCGDGQSASGASEACEQTCSGHREQKPPHVGVAAERGRDNRATAGWAAGVEGERDHRDRSQRRQGAGKTAPASGQPGCKREQHKGDNDDQLVGDDQRHDVRQERRKRGSERRIETVDGISGVHVVGPTRQRPGRENLVSEGPDRGKLALSAADKEVGVGEP